MTIQSNKLLLTDWRTRRRASKSDKEGTTRISVGCA